MFLLTTLTTMSGYPDGERSLAQIAQNPVKKHGKPAANRRG
jgi:hypothetical protein